MKVFPETPDDHRALEKLLKTHEINHFTHTLPEDKTLRVVVRGVVDIISAKDLHDELTDLGFSVISVNQMHRRNKHGEREYMPLALVELVKKEKNREIYHLKHISKIRCRIEPQR